VTPFRVSLQDRAHHCASLRLLLWVLLRVVPASLLSIWTQPNQGQRHADHCGTADRPSHSVRACVCACVCITLCVCACSSLTLTGMRVCVSAGLCISLWITGDYSRPQLRLCSLSGGQHDRGRPASGGGGDTSCSEAPWSCAGGGWRLCRRATRNQPVAEGAGGLPLVGVPPRVTPSHAVAGCGPGRRPARGATVGASGSAPQAGPGLRLWPALSLLVRPATRLRRYSDWRCG
jgi:hypothetical protein